eukprot:SAG31_NODE_32172_length_359_cov_0.726923_1_plen_60_part_10
MGIQMHNKTHPRIRDVQMGYAQNLIDPVTSSPANTRPNIKRKVESPKAVIKDRVADCNGS